MYNVHNTKHEFPYAHKDGTYTWKPKTFDCKIYDNILHAIGNTPLVKLNRIPKDYGVQCDMYGKCEFLNPGGSIKDRIAYTMMMEAQNAGIAKPGTKFVEPTSGNTGIGVALAAAVNGYQCTIVTPDKNSDEKVNTIRLLGAEVVQTPTLASWEDPDSFVSVTKQMLLKDPNAISLDQYSNDINPVTHYECTAEEILSAVGNVDMLVMGAGTGGTLSGVAHKMKERCPRCIIVAVDPKGSIIFEGRQPKLFFVEGIGGDFIPQVLDKRIIDRIEKPDDYEAFNMSRELIQKEGLLCGGSSGAIVFSAIKAIKALNLGPDKRVVVILPDGIRNYMTKFVSDQWMEAHLFKEPPAHDYLMWWNRPISNLKICISVPKIKEEETCEDALRAMGSTYNVALVIDDNGLFKGAISKDSLRYEATNPKKGHSLNLRQTVQNYLIKKCYKIIENKGNPTIGLASRILDITPFLVVVELIRVANSDKEHFIPKGIITPEILLDYIVEHQNNL